MLYVTSKEWVTSLEGIMAEKQGENGEKPIYHLRLKI